MKFPILLSAVALASYASAFYGQIAASDYQDQEGYVFQVITLMDYTPRYILLLPALAVICMDWPSRSIRIGRFLHHDCTRTGGSLD